jgi:hypothetical protein
MTTLATFVRYEVEFLLATLAAIILFQIVTGRIKTRGLLSDKAKNRVPSFSTARLQLLMFTLAGAAYVLSQVLNSVASGTPKFPEIDPNLLVILGGSHALFLGAKSMTSTGSNPNSNT